MTVLEFKQLVNAIPDCENGHPVIMPMHTDVPGLFAFEEVCPAVTEMVDVGPSPDFLLDSRGEVDGKIQMRALLIAPHSFHGDDEDEPGVKDKEKLN